MVFTLSVCLPVCLSVGSVRNHVGCGVLIVSKYFLNFRSKVKVVGHRKVKHVFLVISRRRLVVESRD